MDNVKAPSGLSRDLLTLEEAFRSNLSLLKIKDVEIERCKRTNEILNKTLGAKQKEIDELLSQLSRMQKALKESNVTYEEQLKKVFKDLKQAKQEKALFEGYHRRKMKDVERFYLDLLDDKGKLLKSIEERLAEEITIKERFKRELLEEIHKRKQSECKIIFYESELEKVQTADAVLNIEKEKYLVKMKEENERLSMRLSEAKEKIKSLCNRDSQLKTDDHRVLLQQNEILKELIKEMKREKEKSACEVTNLETLVGLLKERVFHCAKREEFI